LETRPFLSSHYRDLRYLFDSIEAAFRETFIAKPRIERASIAIQNMPKAHGAPAIPVKADSR
jgi:hypothetical protein